MDNFNIIQVRNAKLFNFAESSDINLSNAFTSIFLELFMPLKYGYTCYECPEAHIEQNDVVVDCGAHLGLFSIWGATQGKQVYSFEPSKGIIPYLHKNISLYNNIVHIPKAVGEKEDCKFFSECYFSCGSHLSSIDINKSCLLKEQYQIEVINIDSYFENQRIDFLKIDVEGYEQEVIKGAKATILRDSPKIAVACYHLVNEMDKVKHLLLQINSNYKFKQQKDVLIAWI